MNGRFALKGLIPLEKGDQYETEVLLRHKTQNQQFCWRKSEVFVERVSVRNVIENLAEHGIHCLPCSSTYNIMLS